MPSNELIGIAGVFVLTFCLIALYHFIGVFGRHGKTYRSHIKQIREPERDRRPVHDPRRDAGKDDSWLLWSLDLDAQGGPPKPGSAGGETSGSGFRP